MPTLPLYAQTQATSNSQQWHRVTSPGGYESWQFVIHDSTQNVWLTATLSWGSSVLPSYLMAYERYRRRPTRNRPPLASDFCCASFAFYQRRESGWDSKRFEACAAGDQFGVSRSESGVHVGANRFTVDPHGKIHLAMRGMPWALTPAGPALLRQQTVAANLVLAPSAVIEPRDLELVAGDGPVHRWRIIRPLCAAEGEVRVFDAENEASRALAVSGVGCHQHEWGTRPLAWDFDAGFRSVVLAKDRAVFARLECLRNKEIQRGWIISADMTSASDVELDLSIGSWKRAGFAGVRYPASVQCGSDLRLEKPQIIGHTLAGASCEYQAKLADQPATAFSEFTNWKRLRSQTWGRLVQLGVAKF